MRKVVILGGGFGGLYAAQALRRAPVEVCVIDRRNFHLFQPLLYQVATGSLSPGQIASPLRAILHKQRNTRVLLGNAVDVNIGEHRLILDDDEIAYDMLVVATGSKTSYFGHEDWQSVAPGLKTIEDATRIRHKILFAFEAAERETDPEKRRAWLTFVVAGAGATGVELAGALGEIARDTLKNEFRSIRPEEAQILLLDSAPRVLPPFPEELSKAAEGLLIGLGVHMRNNVKVIGITEDGVTIETQKGIEQIHAKTVIWAAGVRATSFGHVLENRCGAPLDKAGRVLVEPDLTVPGHPDIFVIGDLANVSHNGKPLPGVAPVAMQQGRYAASVIEARLNGKAVKPFHYFDKGSLAVIGRAAAVAQIGKFQFHGLIAWLVWLFVHLMYIVEFENRVLVFIQWGFQYLTYNRGARLITGERTLAKKGRMDDRAG